MLGALAGDVVGSVYERRPIKHIEFPLLQDESRFTDDSVLTVAVADAVLRHRSYAEAIRDWGRRYPTAGYGGAFLTWLLQDGAPPYGSWGNGSAMRVSPIGWAYADADRVLDEARASAEVTHDHPEGIKGGQATALAVFLARSGKSKAQIREEISDRFGYDLARSPDEIRPTYRFEVSCQESVPQSLAAFLHAEDFESTLRVAISLGGDADTMAAIAGAVAEAFYGGVPEPIAAAVRLRLDADLLAVLDAFRSRYDLP